MIPSRLVRTGRLRGLSASSLSEVSGGCLGRVSGASSPLGPGSYVLGVEFPVKVFSDKVAYYREDHHERRLSGAYQGYEEDYEPRDQGSPVFVGPGGHLSNLSFSTKRFLAQIGRASCRERV